MAAKRRADVEDRNGVRKARTRSSISDSMVYMLTRWYRNARRFSRNLVLEKSLGSTTNSARNYRTRRLLLWTALESLRYDLMLPPQRSWSLY
jgi:hypothetical protein